MTCPWLELVHFSLSHFRLWVWLENVHHLLSKDMEDFWEHILRETAGKPCAFHVF